MTREEARKAAEVMLAYADGKIIQYNVNGIWEDIDEFYISEKTIIEKYRIKPQLTYRPFKDGEDCWEEMLNHIPFGWITHKRTPDIKECIVSIDDECIMLVDFSDDKTICVESNSKCKIKGNVGKSI